MPRELGYCKRFVAINRWRNSWDLPRETSGSNLILAVEDSRDVSAMESPGIPLSLSCLAWLNLTHEWRMMISTGACSGRLIWNSYWRSLLHLMCILAVIWEVISMYISRVLANQQVIKVTRFGTGFSVGADIEYAISDPLRAIENRTQNHNKALSVGSFVIRKMVYQVRNQGNN